MSAIQYIDGRGIKSPAVFIMSYALREYNFIHTHIKNMINLVTIVNDAAGDSAYVQAMPHMYPLSLGLPAAG